jgi:hypothetical protein
VSRWLHVPGINNKWGNCPKSQSLKKLPNEKRSGAKNCVAYERQDESDPLLRQTVFGGRNARLAVGGGRNQSA